MIEEHDMTTGTSMATKSAVPTSPFEFVVAQDAEPGNILPPLAALLLALSAKPTVPDNGLAVTRSGGR